MIADPATPDAAAAQQPAQKAREPAAAAALPPLAVRAAYAARICGFTPRQWRSLDSSGEIPKPIVLRRVKVWVYAELRKWLAAGGPPRGEWEAIKAKGSNGLAEEFRKGSGRSNVETEEQRRIKAQNAAIEAKAQRQRGKLDALAAHRRKKEQVARHGDLTEPQAAATIPLCPSHPSEPNECP